MKKITSRLILFLAMMSLGTIAHSQTCTASFSYSLMPNGVVNFYSTSTPVNSITTQYYWNFGNSSSYTATGSPSATTTYTANGSYTVTLFFLTPATCSNMAQAVISVTNATSPGCNINANFGYSQMANGTINFMNTTSGTLSGVSYTWNFGDNSSSAAFSPAHQYSSAGMYTVTLVAANNSTCISTKTLAVSVCTLNFSYTSGPNGFVTFTGSAAPTTSLTYYYWYFGNNTSAQGSNANPASTTYTASGSYAVMFGISSSVPMCSVNITQTVNVTTSSSCNINANFNYGQGSNGLVNFNNTSTGTVSGVSYTWNFGDNSAQSNATSPAHTYSANGTYIATLTANNNLSVTCVSTKTMAINVSSYCALAAGFNFSVNGGSVQFYNTTTPSVGVAYSWNFGNSGTSNATNPSTTYSANGNYVVTLTATTNSFCSSVASQTISITNASTCNINANFGFSQGSNGQVNFNNTSTGTNGSTTYSWTFGDSNNDTIPSPSHTYASNGLYVVTLIASNGGTCTSMKTVTITVNSICNLNASFSFTQVANGQVNFASTSTGTMSGYFYTWAFGDNTNGSGASTSHNYANGSYVVTLTVKNMSVAATCSSTASQTITVTSNTCVANAMFTVVPTSTAQYWNAYPSNTLQNVVSATWSWGDGSFSNTLYTSHQYSAAGTYDLCLSVTVACGASATYCFPYYIFRSSGGSDFVYINVIDPSSTVGLDEAVKAQDFGVYPNPGKGQFIVALSDKRTGDYRLDVLNLIGQTVHSASASGSGGRISVDATHLPEGVYLLDVYENGSRIGIQKIVIDR